MQEKGVVEVGLKRAGGTNHEKEKS